MKRLTVSLLVVLALMCSVTWAQQTIDPLQRLEVEEGDLSYFASLNFFPGGDSFVGTNEAGEAVQITESSKSFGVSLGGSYSVSSDLSLSAGLTPGFGLNSSKILVEAEREVNRNGSASLGGYFSTTYALNRSSALDPTVSMSLSYPFALSADISASLIRDPIVLSGYVGLSKPLASPGADLYFGANVGFIANETISLRLGSSANIPVGVVLPATLSVNARAGYALNPEGTAEVGMTTYLSVSGGNTSLGLGLDFNGRDVSVHEVE